MHVINWDGAEVHYHPYYHQRFALDVWHIHAEHQTMNCDAGPLSLPSVYNLLIHSHVHFIDISKSLHGVDYCCSLYNPFLPSPLVFLTQHMFAVVRHAFVVSVLLCPVISMSYVLHMLISIATFLACYPFQPCV